MAQLNDTIALISATVSAIGALVAIAAFLLNRRAYRIASRQDRSRQPNVALYFVKGEVHHFRELGQRYYDFHLTITNASDATNAVARLRFCLTQRRGGLLSTLEVDPEPTPPIATDLPPNPLLVPCQLAPREVVQGRAIFKVATPLLAHRRRERYHLSLTDGHSKVTTVRVITLNEHDHDAVGNRL